MSIEFKPLERLDLLDDLIYQDEDIFSWSNEKAHEFQLLFISDAFKHHYTNSEKYKAYCDRLGVGPSDIKTVGDLGKIPLLPSGLFKETRVLSCPPTDVVKICESSGTRGTISKVYRDGDTLERF
ncbi:MAG: hypothetical protein AAF449_09930, partial [Myxococcota bacterium]